jgi:hypothetical protein
VPPHSAIPPTPKPSSPFCARCWCPFYGVLVRGRTGKFVPAGYGSGEPGWREIAKGRITIVDSNAGTAEGEVYLGFVGDEASLAEAIAQLSADDFLEIDQYGISAKALSGLTEYYLVRDLKTRGYRVLRMPDMAGHLGSYKNFDFVLEKDGLSRSLEVKSLWGTNTKFARLIHSLTAKPKGPPKPGRLSRKLIITPRAAVNSQRKISLPSACFCERGISLSSPSLVRCQRTSSSTACGQNPLCRIGDGNLVRHY